MFCPQCRSEYVEGMTECEECNVALVAELPPEPESELEYRPFVMVKFYHSRHDAELARSFLEANDVEAIVEADDAGGADLGLDFTRGVKLMVKREDEEKAKELFADSEHGDIAVNDNEQGEETEQE